MREISRFNSVEKESNVNVKDSVINMKEMASEPYAFKLQKGAVSKLERDHKPQ